MIKQFKGYKEEAVVAGAQLPVASYVVKILGVKYVPGDNGNSDRIDLQIDIAEGEQKGFFLNQYNASTDEDKKFKGKASIWLPSDNGSDADKRAIRTFNSITKWLADENAGYHWDWDETKLKGKTIGATFRKEWNVDNNGREYSYTSFAWFCAADDVRNGKAKVANDKFRNGATGKVYPNGSLPSGTNEGFMQIDAEDGVDAIPFD